MALQQGHLRRVLASANGLLPRPLPRVTPLTLSSPTKASLLWIILWRCWATPDHGIARPKPRGLHGNRPSSGCIPMLTRPGITRSILLYMIQYRLSARISEWLLRVRIADLHGSRRKRPGRAESGHMPRLDRIGTGRFEADLNPQRPNQCQRAIGRQGRNGALIIRRRRWIWLREKTRPAGAIFPTRWHRSAIEHYASFRCSSSSDQTSSKQAVCASSSATASAIALPSM